MALVPATTSANLRRARGGMEGLMEWHSDG